MSNLSVDTFKSKIQGGGARPNYFKVGLTFPAGSGSPDTAETASFLCKAASLPASIVNAIPVAFRGRKVPFAGDRDIEPWTITIINDTDFKVRDAFISWQNKLNAHRANTGDQRPATYMQDMYVTQLDKSGRELKTYKFIGCWPSNSSAIDLSYDSENSIEEFTVELQVTYWVDDTVTD